MNAHLAKVRGLVRESGGAELLERLEHLERSRGVAPHREPPAVPRPGTPVDADVILAGGGLSLLLAPILAARGHSVMVVERGRAAAVHREWNASWPELAALWSSGLFTEEAVRALVVARYREGVCRWHGGGVYPVHGVLDHAVDAAGLLEGARRSAEALGVVFLDRTTVLGEAAGSDAVAVHVEGPGGRAVLHGRLLLDGRGAASPYAAGDLLCPTVGGVLSGLGGDPEVGDILATTEGVEEGHQHVWEAFPGRPGETTVYLFYYARAKDVEPGSLLRLYARFFERREGYREGEGALLRPTFGYIPGWSRLGPAPRSPSRRIVLLGDAAGRHSPLTWCGFGAMLRSLEPAAQAISTALETKAAPDDPVVDDRALHGATGLLSLVMANPDPQRPDDLNGLLDAAFASLHALGNEAYAGLIRDEMSARAFVRFLGQVATRRPQVFRDVPARLGLGPLGGWAGRLARDALHAR